MLDPNLQALLSKQAYVQALEETGRNFTPGYNSQTELLYKSLYERWVEEGVTLVDEGLDDDDHFSLLDIMKHLVEHQGTNPYLTKDARCSISDFLNLMANGPCARASNQVYNNLWSFYTDLIQNHSQPKPITHRDIFKFHFVFMELYQPQSGYEDERHNLLNVALRLGVCAAQCGNIDVMYTCISNWSLSIEQSLKICSYLPLELEPKLYASAIASYFLHVIMNAIGSQDWANVSPECLDEWFHDRIRNISTLNRNLGTDLNLGLDLCQAGAHVISRVNDALVQTNLNVCFTTEMLDSVQIKWRSILCGDHNKEHSDNANPMTPKKHEVSEELQTERSRSAGLERRVKDLTETCHALEEEACTVHQEVERLSSPKKEEQSSHQTVEALENALRLQVEKRIEAEDALLELKDRISQGAHTGANIHISMQTHVGNERITNPSLMVQSMKDLISEIEENNAEPQSACHTFAIDEQLVEFEELLSDFLSETDGLDGDESESAMDRKDIIWFLNELKLRFVPIQKRYLKDSEMLKRFTNRLAKMLESAPADDDSSSSKDKKLLDYKERVETQEVEISVLKGYILQLKESMQKEKKIRITSDSKQRPTQFGQGTEMRHRALINEMQSSIETKNIEISALKEEIKIKESTTNLAEEPVNKPLLTEPNEPNKLNFAFQEIQIKSLREDIEERDTVIQEMKSELEQIEAKRKMEEPSAADKVRLRYLEGIVHDLERKLAEAKGTHPKSCKYGSISLFDMSYPLENNSVDIEDNHVEKSKEMENIKSKIADFEKTIREGDLERQLMINDFESEKTSLLKKLNDAKTEINQLKSSKMVHQ